MIPITLFSGFLGAGKTTLLNHILKSQPGKRIAVIENEVGTIGIDGSLVETVSENVIELSNGCVCCNIKGELLHALFKLIRGSQVPDRIIIESTGIADPAPIIQTLLLEPILKELVYLDGVITLLDAVHFEQQWERSKEIEKQVAMADVIVISKTDIAPIESVNAIESVVRPINQHAPIYASTLEFIPLENMLDLNAHNLKAKSGFSPTFTLVPFNSKSPKPKLDHDIVTIGLTEYNALDIYCFELWMENLLRAEAENLYRYKGILNIHGYKHRMVFQGVHSIIDSLVDRDWDPEEVPCSSIVFIGKNLNKEAIESGFRACVQK